LDEFCRFDQGVENRCRSFGWPGLLVVRCSRGVLISLKFLDTWRFGSLPLSDCSSKAQFLLVELSWLRVIVWCLLNQTSCSMISACRLDDRKLLLAGLFFFFL
jgi:hypothetical protein